MSEAKQQKPSKRLSFSLDTWAVLIGLSLAALVRLGLVQHVSW